MKFTLDKSALLKNLQLLSKAIPSRSTLPIISSALFTVKDEILYMRATDLEISINLKYKIEGGEDGCVAIPLGKLLEITNALPNTKINFSVSDIGKINIDCNAGQYTIMGQPCEEFPTEQKIENPLTIVKRQCLFIIIGVYCQLNLMMLKFLGVCTEAVKANSILIKLFAD